VSAAADSSADAADERGFFVRNETGSKSCEMAQAIALQKPVIYPQITQIDADFLKSETRDLEVSRTFKIAQIIERLKDGLILSA
jgi:hypothetical protein